MFAQEQVDGTLFLYIAKELLDTPGSFRWRPLWVRSKVNEASPCLSDPASIQLRQAVGSGAAGEGGGGGG